MGSEVLDPAHPLRLRAVRGPSMASGRRSAAGLLDSRPAAQRAGGPLTAGLHDLDLGPGIEAVLAVPPGAPVPRPLLLFFHGAGGSAAHSLGLITSAARARDVLVLAPTSMAATWDGVAGGWGRDVAVVDEALEQVFGRTAVTRTAVAGFSDGASYALSLGLANGDLLDAVLAFSPGFVAPPAERGRPRVWISHGTADRVLPVDRCGRRVSRDLTAAGYDVTYEEFDGGHVVPADATASALDWWLRRP